ncbi:alpha-N-acetylglucosaminidase-like isoform X2 [Mytilus californianus]|uniref:alpha-N-acetylglucosaminidase-like isoform X2 n=1 Tax=Mytilus californianus TaxID=6549 RepID=UPI002247431F|nr:alpha-N-acetylglucosaminidase-like isoform X2 [Mytilus californianus]
MKFLLLVLISSAMAAKEFHTLDVLYSRVPADAQQRTVTALIQRVVGARASQFKAIVNPALGPNRIDTFHLVSENGTVTIGGSTGVAVAMGLYYYLTNFCNCQITWAGQQLDIPKELPKLPKSGVTVSANDRFRYYQNVCTVSYSFVWYKWEDWEKQLDWMALHGLNLPLAFTGQEAIFQRVYMKMGMTMKDMQTHFGGPAFQAWSRMGNMRGWGGPVTQTWLNDQLILQHKILDRMRALGMIPVLPGFAGHVPEALSRLHPKANVSRLRDWGRFNETYCCTYLLDFGDPLFKEIGVSFIKEMEYEFGVDHIYNVDSFNEMKPKSGSAEYLQEVGSIIFDVLQTGDPDAIWLMQGWLFQDKQFWQQAQIKAMLTSVPEGKMIVLDLFSEVSPIYTYTESYYGQPYIWCMLHDFGGTMELYGALDSINTGPFEGRNMTNSTMVGLGLTPEGIYQNEVIYEFFMENVWRKQPRDITKWISDFTRKRYGKYNKFVDLAWQYLKKSVFNNTDGLRDHDKNSIPTSRPRHRHQLHPHVWFDPEDLYAAWDLLILSADQYKNNTLYQYDLVDVTRNSLQIISIEYYNKMIASVMINKTEDFLINSRLLLELLNDMETLLASDSHFLLGKWIAAAKSWATDISESFNLEFNARNQITLWGPRGEILDYACKQWSGLLKGYYIPRWQLFVEMLHISVIDHTKFNETLFAQIVYEKVELPFSNQLDDYPTEPIGDAYAIATSIHKKYRNMIDKEFFQVYAAQSRKVKDNRNMIEKKYGLNPPVYDILVKT